MEPRRALRAALMLGGKDAKPHDTRWEPNLADIPGLLFWHDPTDPSKMSVDPNDGIDLFIPQIGNAANFTLAQPTEANRPISEPGPNGKNIVSFPSGSSRWLDKLDAPVNHTQGGSLIVAWMNNDISVARGLVSMRGFAPNNIRLDFHVTTGSDLMYRYGDAGGVIGTANRAITVSEWNISTTRTREHWLNGGNPQTLADGTLAGIVPTLLEYGRSTATAASNAGALGHWLYIEGPVSDDMLRRLEGFVAWDLGIQATALVPGHPWKNRAP
jgi:hypothetical protein